MIRILKMCVFVCHHVMPSTSTHLPLVLHVCVSIVSVIGLLPVWHQAISRLCISWIVQQIKICMFKLNLKHSVILLISMICLLRCIKFELNWIGIERKWIELELNWKILNPIGIGIELNWKKWIDPSPGTVTSREREVLALWRHIRRLFLHAQIKGDLH